MNAELVRLQPWRWIPDQQAWAPATDAFHELHRTGDWWQYSLPSDQPAKLNYSPAVPAALLPKGWAEFKPEDLSAHIRPLSPEAALRYFDGAVPDWSTALSTSIPRRHIVHNLVERFRQADEASEPMITLLLAAGCEGKTTALLQAAYSIVEGKNNWRILQRRDESRPLVPEEILPLLDEKYIWLLLIDEVDRTATDLQALLKRLPAASLGRVHALLACRDTDWLNSPAAKLDWTNVIFNKEQLRGLDLTDASAIVQSWQAFGEAGLGDLAKQPAAKHAAILERQAKNESQTQGGAFFGALLTVRNGSDLLKHAHLLLERLGQRKIPSGGTLRDALAYIAAMHASGLEFLSRPVLAEVLRCPTEKIHREVLVPLGQEAATTTTSSFIYVRHRRIAQALVSALRDEFGEDIDSLYVSLGEAAICAFNKGLFVPELGSWRFRLSDNFFEIGQKELAFKIAKGVLNQESTKSQSRTHAANLFRRAGLQEQAVLVFRENTSLVNEDRGYYHEWGVAEGYDHPTNSSLLIAFALSDQCPARQVDNDQAKKGLASLGVVFGTLYETYHRPFFRDARMAVAVLGSTLRLDAEAKGYLDRHFSEAAAQGAPIPDLERAVLIMQAGIFAAVGIGVTVKIAELLPRAETLTFDGLQELARHSFHAKRQSGLVV